MNYKKRIGIDIDGVLTNIQDFRLIYGSKFMSTKYHKGIQNHKACNIKEMFDVDSKIEDEFWEAYFWKYSLEIPPRPFASEVIKKLHDAGYEIYIMTARAFLDEKNCTIEKRKETTREWLLQNNIIYDQLIFTPEDKLESCLEYNIDIMIDDSITNVNSVSKKIPVICFHTYFNENCKGENITRCYTWYDIYEKIITD